MSGPAIAVGPHTTDADIYSAWFGVSHTAAVVLVAILSGPPEGRTVSRLRRATSMAPDTIRSAMVRLREAMEPGSLATNGLTRRLTDVGRKDCADAMADARRRA